MRYKEKFQQAIQSNHETLSFIQDILFGGLCKRSEDINRTVFFHLCLIRKSSYFVQPLKFGVKINADYSPSLFLQTETSLLFNEPYDEPVDEHRCKRLTQHTIVYIVSCS